MLTALAAGTLKTLFPHLNDETLSMFKDTVEHVAEQRGYEGNSDAELAAFIRSKPDAFFEQPA